MRISIYLLKAVLLTTFLYFVAHASDDSLRTACATITIHSGTPGVIIFSDSVKLGATPIDSALTDTGKHILIFVHPETRNWFYSAIIETVSLAPSEHLFRKIDFPILYHVTSEPFGATVRSGDSVLGQTPLVVSSVPIKSFLTFSKDGYEDLSVPVSADQQHLHGTLISLNGSMLGRKSEYLSQESSKSNLNIYITTGATVVTGLAAAYFKTKADSYYSEYQRTTDPSLLNKVRTYDTISGISLSASEISLFVLSYLLLSR